MSGAQCHTCKREGDACHANESATPLADLWAFAPSSTPRLNHLMPTVNRSPPNCIQSKISRREILAVAVTVFPGPTMKLVHRMKTAAKRARTTLETFTQTAD